MRNGRARSAASSVLILLLGACRSDYTFHTVAIYEAPRSHCLVRIEASGVVRGGDDVSSDARGALTVHATGSQDQGIRSDLALHEGRVLFGGFAPGPERESLSVLLADAGCAPVQDEWDELVWTTEGVLRGPKGTPMDGQTKTLKVRATTFDH